MASPIRCRYLQKPSVEVAEASGAFLPPKPSDRTSENGSENLAAEVAIDSGVVVFSGPATIALRGLAFSDAFKGCTARGVAAGAAALRLELYSDLLLALKTGSAEQDDGAERIMLRRRICVVQLRFWQLLVLSFTSVFGVWHLLNTRGYLGFLR